MGRIEKEKKTITLMIDIYCKRKHKHKDGLCEECQELLEYAHKRLDFCKFGEEKSFCSKCPIHCYKKDMKAKVKDVKPSADGKDVAPTEMWAPQTDIDAINAAITTAEGELTKTTKEMEKAIDTLQVAMDKFVAKAGTKATA